MELKFLCNFHRANAISEGTSNCSSNYSFQFVQELKKSCDSCRTAAQIKEVTLNVSLDGGSAVFLVSNESALQLQLNRAIPVLCENIFRSVSTL